MKFLFNSLRLVLGDMFGLFPEAFGVHVMAMFFTLYMCSSMILGHYAALLDMHLSSSLPFMCSKNNPLSKASIDSSGERSIHTDQVEQNLTTKSFKYSYCFL